MVEPGSMKLQAWTTPTPAGLYGLVVHDGSVVTAGFTADLDELLELAPDNDGAEFVSDISGVTDRITAYLAGDLGAVDDIPVAPVGTARKKAAWDVMRTVGPGTISYRELARRMAPPASPRSAARACATNPIALIVPCHRFIGSDGKLHGYYWGLDIKEWLLEHERRFIQ
jgi:methylated-DNA-[protein]-cysteine S-methyltransferase